MIWHFNKGLLTRWQTYALVNHSLAQNLNIYIYDTNEENECVRSYKLYVDNSVVLSMYLCKY